MTSLIKIPGGTFMMGSDDHYPEEGPAHRVRVGPFRLAATTVTNAEFAAFVEATGYVTVAERDPDPALYPGAPASVLVPGSTVFRMTDGPVPLHDFRRWWSWVTGACWRHPEGPGSDIADRADHPVVHVAFEDAEAYVAWAGLRLPTEAEWEFAARGGLEGAEFAWGDELFPDGEVMANTWLGEFPYRRTSPYERTSPVGSYPANPYGLFDMIGNVWEWTADTWSERHALHGEATTCCGASANPTGTIEEEHAGGIPRRVLKGGSFLCAPSYCRRYRPAARHAQTVDTGTSHLGFRCAS